MAEMDLREEVRVAWGTGIAGYVAESGEPVNIPDAYQVKLQPTRIDSSFFTKGFSNITKLNFAFSKIMMQSFRSIDCNLY
jgi:hypothetical protein